MTARERAELQGLVSVSTTVLRGALYLLAVAVTGWVCRGLQTFLGEAVGRTLTAPIWLLPTLVLGGLLYVRGTRWTGGRELRARIRHDLDRGELAQHRVEVVQALEAPEVEDEGPVFFVRERGGKTLFFAGQDMARQKARGFPWREFEIVEAPESRRLFKLRSLGEAFPDVQARAPLAYDEAKQLGVLSANYGTLDLRLEELRKDP
jgi:hypothetical protein